VNNSINKFSLNSQVHFNFTIEAVNRENLRIFGALKINEDFFGMNLLGSG